MSFMAIVLMIIIVIMLKDVIVRIPGFIVGVVDTIGHMPAKEVAIAVLVIVGIVLIFKKTK